MEKEMISVINDKNLSWTATGLLLYMLSFPKGHGFSLEHLVKQTPEGQDSVRSGLTELERAGYLRIEQRREAGKMATAIWHVSDTPVTDSARADE